MPTNSFAATIAACEDCLTREVTCKDADGQEFKKTQYYHKQVYAQLSGPELSVILDVEPMRQGEEECAAGLAPAAPDAPEVWAALL